MRRFKNQVVAFVRFTLLLFGRRFFLCLLFRHWRVPPLSKFDIHIPLDRSVISQWEMRENLSPRRRRPKRGVQDQAWAIKTKRVVILLGQAGDGLAAIFPYTTNPLRGASEEHPLGDGELSALYRPVSPDGARGKTHTKRTQKLSFLSSVSFVSFVESTSC